MKTLFRVPTGAVLIAAVAIGVFSGCASTTAGHESNSAAVTPPASAVATIDLSEQLQRLESHFAARIGVSAVDTGTGTTIRYRADDRFGYASTLKTFVVAKFLSVIPAADRDAVATWTQADIDAAGYSPITSEHIPDGLTLAQLAEAAVRTSDNTATNIIFKAIGGPEGLQDLLRRSGDNTSRIVNIEPALNLVEAGNTNDTTTPAAFTANLQALLTGTLLSNADKATLVDWMSGNATGDSLIRAGAPDGWTVSDKSGGAFGTRNDIAIVTPPGRDPIIVTIFTTKNAADAEYDNNAVADTAKAVLEALA